MKQTVPLRRVARVLNGGTPRPDLENWNGDVLWATPVDLAEVDGRTLHATRRTLTDKGLATGSTLAPAGAILLSTRAPIGYTAKVARPTAFNQGCKALVPSEGIHPRFLQFCLIAHRNHLREAGQGSTFPELSNEALLSFAVPRVHLAAQRRIADFLDDRIAHIDGVSSLREQQVGGIREYALAQLADSVSAFPRAQLRRLGVSVTTGPFGTAFSANEYAPDGVPMINPSHIERGVIRPDERHLVAPDIAARLARHQLRPGDVIVSRKGDLGRSALVLSEQTGWLCGSDCIALRTDGIRLLPAYLDIVLRLPEVRHRLLAHSNAVTMPNLNEGTLLSLEIPHADLPMQSEIVRAANIAFRSITEQLSALRRSLEALAEYKQSLITAAVSGEFDITTASDRSVPAWA